MGFGQSIASLVPLTIHYSGLEFLASICHIAARSFNRCIPRHKVFTPGSPSLLRPKKPPNWAIQRTHSDHQQALTISFAGAESNRNHPKSWHTHVPTTFILLLIPYFSRATASEDHSTIHPQPHRDYDTEASPIFGQLEQLLFTVIVIAHTTYQLVPINWLHFCYMLPCFRYMVPWTTIISMVSNKSNPGLKELKLCNKIPVSLTYSYFHLLRKMRLRDRD